MQTWTWRRLLAVVALAPLILLAVVVLSPLILLMTAFEGLSWAFATAMGWEADEW